jgi:hypothetical protein
MSTVRSIDWPPTRETTSPTMFVVATTFIKPSSFGVERSAADPQAARLSKHTLKNNTSLNFIEKLSKAHLMKMKIVFIIITTINMSSDPAN